MIRGVYPTASLPSIGYAISASRGGKTALPVTRASYIYSHFKHVSGVPAPEGGRGVTINKLKVLDALIERLAQLKRQREPAAEDAGMVSPGRIDAMIEQYQGQVRQAQATGIALPYSPLPPVSAGMVFSLVA
jgi:hypothetical protein